MTEEDTFNALKKWSRERVTEESKRLANTIDSWEEYYVLHGRMLQRAGWTLDEYREPT